MTFCCLCKNDSESVSGPASGDKCITVQEGQSSLRKCPGVYVCTSVLHIDLVSRVKMKERRRCRKDRDGDPLGSFSAISLLSTIGFNSA